MPELNRSIFGERQKVLVIEDEPDIRKLIRVTLEAEGFSTIEAGDGDLGLALARRDRPAAVILDLMLPGISGFDVCRRLRAEKETASIPIIMLTARASETDKVVGLELGADDYMTKPFSSRELAARVKALLRRSHVHITERPHETYERGGLRVDLDSYEVFVDGERVDLALREFELLRFFVTHPNRVFERGQLLDLVWGPDRYVEPRTVDVHVRRLRQHIERDDSSPEHIVTVRGVGYMFDERSSREA